MEKRDLALALNRIDNKLWGDAHYQKNYKNAERCDSWGYTLKFKLGDFKRAEKYYQRRLETNEGSAIWLYDLGKRHFQAGRIDSACVYLSRAAVIDTNNADLMANLAIVLNILKKDDEAVQYARKAIALMDSSNVNVLTQIGMIFSKPGLFDEALRCFTKAYQLAPDSYKQAIYLGQFYYNQNEFDSAFVYYNRGLELSGGILLNDARFLYQLALAETELEKFEPALEHCRRASQLMPVKPEINKLCEKIERVLNQRK
ncbi:MAG: tetratricopeptide repeat protein [candidate division Zixibacteria bacterium]|nr:tetratricopeptide repeat protein [candidate division Zixibacteria bacterium]